MNRRHYHLIGIGGTAMASVAGLLRSAGHTVTGSDENVYPPMSDQLREQGIEYAEGYRAENLRLGPSGKAPDMVIVGNAISRGNPELEEVLLSRLPYTSAAAIVKEEFLRERRPIAIAGTHGKTTTTSITAWVLEVAGFNPSFLIGGIAENFGSSFRLTDSPWFVVEADEYDTAYFDKGPKMWHYLPHVAVVNNVEFDHADIYRDEEAYRLAFARFINLIPGNGKLIAGWESPILRELAPAAFCPVEPFGYPVEEGLEPFWRAEKVTFGETTTRFTVVRGDEVWGDVETPLPGAFNVRNCLAAIAVAEEVGADRERVKEGLRTFRSVRRRMEVRGEAAGITVVDDFAHHPTAVRETLQAARQRFSGRKVVAVFEPRSYTAQRREFQERYTEVLRAADHVVLAGLSRPERYSRDTGMDPEEIVAALRADEVDAHHIPAVDDIVRHLTRELEGGEVVVIMSNGGFGGIHNRLLTALQGDG